MKPADAKPFVPVFLVVLALYLGIYYGLEFVRHRKGPWKLEFSGSSRGEPVVQIQQSTLNLTNVTLIFHGEEATNRLSWQTFSGSAAIYKIKVSFGEVKQPVPFGRLLYQDLTFLPGVLTFDFYGHEIEILPRVLVVNKREFPWQSGTTIDLWPTNKPATLPQPPKQRG